jgi:hypothetical protein
MKKIKITHIPFLLIAIAIFYGCSLLMYHREPRTGLYERSDDYTLEMFADTVDREIQSELHGDKMDISWRKYWIDWCETLHYDPNLGDTYVQYIIDKRRAAGLPEIPEIVNKQGSRLVKRVVFELI